MLKLRLATFFAPFAVVSVLLAGCPDGAGLGLPGQDGGADADADARDDGPTGEGGNDDGAATEGGGPTPGSGALCGANHGLSRRTRNHPWRFGQHLWKEEVMHA